LPPTFIDVGTQDLFRDGDLALAALLLQAGPRRSCTYIPAKHAAELFDASVAAARSRTSTTSGR
jgi:acetyl esterase/lipase